MQSQTLTELKAQALGRSRQAAAEALIPRILAAADAYGEPSYDGKCRGVRSTACKGAFRIHTDDVDVAPTPSTYFEVSWQGRLMMAGHVCPPPLGMYLDRQVFVMSWIRSERHKQWQTEFFDTFDLTGYRACMTALSLMGPRRRVFEILNHFFPGHWPQARELPLKACA
jgi:hypothetical protein